MKKTYSLKAYPARGRTKKVWMIMKAMFVFLVIGMVQVSASVYSQQTRFSMNLTNVEVDEVIKEIKRTSEFDFVFDYDLISKLDKVSVNVEDATVEDILSQCLENSNMDFRIHDKVILIVPAEIKKEKVEIQEPEKISLSGCVVDDLGEPIPGVNISVKGAGLGTVSDVDGNFELYIEKQTGTLVFSFVGFEDQERPFSGSETFNISLVPAISIFDEVMVLGTGLTKISKERATGSYSVMTRSEIVNSPNEEIGASLEGVISGLQSNYNAETGENEISIRGVSTIESNASPLIVVDGFPVEGDFSTINPNDIQSITVLKDAAAASIWGARAGNGVIVIVTRKGKNSGKFNVEVGSYLKFGEEMDWAYNLPGASANTVLDLEKYQIELGYGADMGLPNSLNNAYIMYSKGQQAYYEYKEGLISKADLSQRISNLRSIDSRDDINKYLLRKPFTQQHSVSINGSNDRSNYALSVLYNDVKDHFKENRNQKVLVNFRNSYQLKEWLNLKFAMMSEFKKVEKDGADLAMLREISPYENLVNEDGTYAQVNHQINYAFMNKVARTAEGIPYKNWGYNPLQEVLNRDYNTNHHNTRIQAGLDLKLIEGLHFIPSFQFERFKSEEENYNNDATYYTRNVINNHVDYDPETNTVTRQYVPNGGILNQRFHETTSYDVRNQLTYDKTIGEDHEINLVAATEHIWKTFDAFSDNLYGYNPDDNTYVNPPFGYGSSEMVMGYIWSDYYNNGHILGGDTYYSNNSKDVRLQYSNERVFSMFANVAYTYKKKYTLTGSYRTDASNMIVDDPKFRYSPFWSVGGSWNAKKESFLSDMDMFDKLTLRATYGVSGNTITTASTVPVVSLSSSPSMRTGAFEGEITDLGNPTLRWEKVNSLNVAVEYSLFDRLLYGSFEVYNKQSEDLLASVSIASTYGDAVQSFNAAEVSNKGFELNVNSKLDLGPVTWKTGINLSHNKSMVESLQVDFLSARSMPGLRYVEGEAVAPAYSYIYGGMQDANTPIIEGENGITYTMYEGIGYNGENGPEILRNMGTFIAPTLVGWTNTFQYKGFTLRALMTGKFGHVFRRPTYDYDFGLRNKSFVHEDLDIIMAGGAEKLGIPDLPEEYVNSTARMTFYAPYLNTLVEKADHIRLKELYLGYKLSDKITNKLGIDKLTVFAHARDLGTLWTANKYDIDPEFIKGRRFNPGASYTVGFNLGF